MTADRLSGDDDMLVDIDAEVAAANGWTSLLADDEPDKPTKDEPKKDAVPAVSAEDLETARRAAAEAQARLEALTKTTETERAARLKAQADADRNQTYAVNAHLARTQANLDRVKADHDSFDTAISQWKAQADMAVQQMASAAENGDWKAHANMQATLAEAKATVAQLEAGRAGAKAQIDKAAREQEEAVILAQEASKRKPEPETDKKTITPDELIGRVRQAIGNPGADWLQSHREFTTDERMYRKLQTFMEDWVDRNGESALRTPALAEALDARFFPKPAPKTEDDDVSEEEEAPRRAAPAAPVSRQSNSASRSPGSPAPAGKVRLSPDEQATALQMYPEMSPADARKRYATNKARLQAEGRL